MMKILVPFLLMITGLFVCCYGVFSGLDEGRIIAGCVMMAVAKLLAN